MAAGRKLSLREFEGQLVSFLTEQGIGRANPDQSTSVVTHPLPDASLTAILTPLYEFIAKTLSIPLASVTSIYVHSLAYPNPASTEIIQIVCFAHGNPLNTGKLHIDIAKCIQLHNPSPVPAVVPHSIFLQEDKIAAGEEKKRLDEVLDYKNYCAEKKWENAIPPTFFTLLEKFARQEDAQIYADAVALFFKIRQLLKITETSVRRIEVEKTISQSLSKLSVSSNSEDFKNTFNLLLGELKNYSKHLDRISKWKVEPSRKPAPTQNN